MISRDNERYAKAKRIPVTLFNRKNVDSIRLITNAPRNNHRPSYAFAHCLTCWKYQSTRPINKPSPTTPFSFHRSKYPVCPSFGSQTKSVSYIRSTVLFSTTQNPSNPQPNSQCCFA